MSDIYCPSHDIYNCPVAHTPGQAERLTDELASLSLPEYEETLVVDVATDEPFFGEGLGVLATGWSRMADRVDRMSAILDGATFDLDHNGKAWVLVCTSQTWK